MSGIGSEDGRGGKRYNILSSFEVIYSRGTLVDSLTCKYVECCWNDKQIVFYLLSFPFHCLNRRFAIASPSSLYQNSLERGGLM